MTDTLDTPEVPVPSMPQAGSLEDKIAQRRRDREQKRKTVLTIPIPGYEDLFAASYKRLTFEQKRTISYRHENVGSDATDEVGFAADLLQNACTDLLEVVGENPDGSKQYRSLGVKWITASIIKLFQIELPATATARTALMAAFDSEDLMDHFGRYTRESNALDEDDQKELPGESVPSVEG
jgi:hypothetical protein